jgi:hypothetical protein
MSVQCPAAVEEVEVEVIWQTALTASVFCVPTHGSLLKNLLLG